MFERRLKIFLALLLVFTLVLAGRAMHVQVISREYWTDRSVQSMKRTSLTETTRGAILDFRGREVAVDAACIDACVDYRAIHPDPDPQWVRSQAVLRVQRRLGSQFRQTPQSQRRRMIDAEVEQVRADMETMWDTLAEVSGHSREQIEEIRRQIVHRVEMRQRFIWYRRYELALQRHETREPAPWYRQWLIDGTRDVPQLDSFAIVVEEQVEPHVILRNIDAETYNLLGKNVERFPGLVLRPGSTRHYPYAEAAAHVLGRLSSVTREDLQDDPFGADELRHYLPNDLIGRTGLEALAEPILRGSRGRTVRMIGSDRVVETIDPAPGRDARITLDIELQRDIQRLFHDVTSTGPDGTTWTHPMHGAAVVIDVPTGQVRALVSHPTYDLNQFNTLFASLSADEIDRPLLNRATQGQLEPGSTVKTIVGLGAVTQGLVRADEGIECTGDLVLNGVRIGRPRCWVASQYVDVLGGNVAHHPIPWHAPHPSGFLTFADAIERSCNIYFEVLADQMRNEGLSYWFERFGLGRPTGIGIPEAAGRLPGQGGRRMSAAEWRRSAWYASIGQGQILATPLQMANVAATIARDGVWVRPRLVLEDEGSEFGVQDSGSDLLNPEPATRNPPDRVDLKLSPDAVAAVKEGMVKVLASRAGTGRQLWREDVTIAGKTGSAQAAPFRVPMRDRRGEVMKDENGRVQWRSLEPSTSTNPNPEAPWYRGTGDDETNLTHGWFIGYAPAENPQIALAVMVEYGGSGGRDITAAIASEVIEACVEHGYLSLRTQRDP